MTSQMTLRGMLIAALLSSTGLAACVSIEERRKMEEKDNWSPVLDLEYEERGHGGEGHSD